MQRSFEWGGVYQKNPSRRKLLEDLLPDHYNYKIEEFQPIAESHIFCESKFSAVFCVNCCSIEDCNKFFDDMKTLSNTDYNKTSHPDKFNLKKFKMTGRRKCVQNVTKFINENGEVLADQQEGKNTECEGSYSFKLSYVDPHEHDENCTNFALKVTLHYEHNHDILSSHSFRFHSVRPSTKETLIELFKQGGTPSSVYYEYLNLMENKHKENFVKVSADRSICPDFTYVFNQFKIWKDKQYGKINSPEAFRLAEEKIAAFNEKSGETVAKMKQLSDGEYVIAVCDNFCRRVHRYVPASGDIIFVDATSGFDRQDSKLVRLMCPSAAGGLPVGWCILSSETEAVQTAGFQLLKEVMPPGAFYGRGDRGPQLIMTDDAEAEKKSLRSVWREPRQLLCVWHLLKANWLWVWQATHEILKEDRPHLQALFHAMVYAESETEYEEAKEALEEDEIIAKYPQYLRHLERRYFPRHEEWSISVRYRDQLPTHGNNTSNYCERAFRVEKDQCFNRCRAYNVNEVLTIKLDDHEHYRRRLINLGNGLHHQFRQSKYKVSKTKLKKDQIQEIGDGVFAVQSLTDPDVWYSCNMYSGYCQCMGGRNCGPCVHKSGIALHFKVAMFNVLPSMDPRSRALYHLIAVGQAQDAAWYRTSEDHNEVADVDQFVEDYEAKCSSAPENLPVLPDLQPEHNNDQMEEEADDVQEEDGDDEEEVLEYYVNVMDRLQQTLFDNISDPQIKKSTKYFAKQIEKSLKGGNLPTIARTLYQIGGVTAPKGVKRKHSAIMPVQKDSKLRRLHKHRGSGPAPSGAKVKDLRPHSKVFSEETGAEDVSISVVRHSLPPQKKQKPRQKHSLKDAVEANRPVSKKH